MTMYHPHDSRLEHRAIGAAPLTTTTVLDTIDQTVAMRTAYRTHGSVEAIDIANSDEVYTLVVELSDDNFSTVNEVVSMVDFGDTAVRQSGAPDTVAGDDFEILWTTEYNGNVYRYARLKLFVAGTSPSITLNARSAKLGDV